MKLSTSLIPKTGWGKNDQKKGQNLAGVKKCFILAICHDTPENHHNISILFETVNIWGVKGWYVFDYKTKKYRRPNIRPKTYATINGIHVVKGVLIDG